MNKKYTINMRSGASAVEGHGVLSAYYEMVNLVNWRILKFTKIPLAVPILPIIIL